MLIDIAKYAGTLLVGIMGTAGFTAWIKARAQGPATKVAAVDKLNDSTLEWAEALKNDAADLRQEVAEYRKETADARRETAAAHREATGARDEAAEARRQMKAVSDAAEQLAAELHKLRRAILAPDVTIERLRLLVGPGDSHNGTGR